MDRAVRGADHDLREAIAIQIGNGRQAQACRPLPGPEDPTARPIGGDGHEDIAGRVEGLVSAAAILLLPKPGEHFTEFYILGPEGLAESYPREAAVGEPLSVTAGIHNLEGVAAEYQIEVWAGEQQIGAAGPLRLADGETWEGPVAYALPLPGDDQQVHFYLYRDASVEPYRSLRLWIDVVEEKLP